MVIQSSLRSSKCLRWSLLASWQNEGFYITPLAALHLSLIGVLVSVARYLYWHYLLGNA